MMPLYDRATGLSDGVVLWLLVFALRATVLLGAAWLATRLLRRASAATRHLIWAASIAGVLALPVLAVLVPSFDVAVVSLSATVAPPRNSDAPLGAKVVAPPSAPATGAEPAIATSTIRNVDAAGVAQSRSPGVVSATRTALAAVVGRLTTNTMLALVWALLALLLLSRLVIANARVSAWQRRSQPVEEERWLALLRRLSRQYGIERPVALLRNPESDVPVTWGVVYPVVLIPETAEQWDEEQRVAVLTHELAHVKRFDALTQQLAQFALAILWFHPLVWMAVRKMRQEREHACDDFVLVSGARASRYADDLLGFARRLTRPAAPAAAALAMARRSELEGRLLAILDPGTKRSTVRGARVGLLMASVMGLAIPLAAFRPAARVATIAPVSGQVAAHDSARSDALDRKNAPSLATLMDRVVPPRAKRTNPELPAGMAEPLAMLAQLATRPDTEPQRPIDVETLIDVTRAAKKMTSDHEKGLLLALIAKKYVRNDALRDAYLDAVFTMTSDLERSQALIALLDRDSLPTTSTAKVLRSAAMMTSDMSRGTVLKRISPATFADSSVQRAYLDVIVSMTSDFERGAAISALVKHKPLTPAVQIALVRATQAMTSDLDKANVLLLFIDTHGLADDAVRRALMKSAATFTSDLEYRRVMTAVMR